MKTDWSHDIHSVFVFIGEKELHMMLMLNAYIFLKINGQSTQKVPPLTKSRWSRTLRKSHKVSGS